MANDAKHRAAEYVANEGTRGDPENGTADGGTHRLSDGRELLGDALAHPVQREQQALGRDFVESASYDGPRLGTEFADAEYADRQDLANAFADPNSIDDRALGNEFEKTNSSAKKHHKPVKEIVRKPASRKTLYWIVGGIVLFFLVLLIIGIIPRLLRGHKADARAKQEKNALPVVEVVRVKSPREGSGLVLPGTTTPLTEASVYARASGYLKQRFVDIGDHVRKGQVLALIDAPDLDQQVDQAREQVRQAEAQEGQQETQLALTEVTVVRYRALVARGVFSRQEGDQREADFQAQRANVAAAKRNVEAFKANLRRVLALQSYERVTAPFDGVVTARNVDTGAFISTSGSASSSAPTPMQTSGQQSAGQGQSGQTNTSGSSGSASNLATPSTGGSAGGPLFTVAQTQRLRILVSVPEGYASELATGQHAQIRFQEFPNQVFYGDVTRTSDSIDQNTRTLLAEVQVSNEHGRLLSGMYAVVTFAPPAQAPAGNNQGGPVLVSGDAIAIRNDRPVVAVVSPEGKVHLQPVTIGRDFGAETEIVAGLHPGDTVAASFTDDIIEDAKVKIAEDKKAEQKANPEPPPTQATPPGGSTQYGDPGITDQNMQGQGAKQGQKKSGGGDKKGSGSKGGKP